MHYSLRSVYDILDVDLPYKLDSGMAIWTLLDGNVGSELHCVNPATNDSRDLRLPSDGYPEKIDGFSIINKSGNLHPEVSEIPIRVIINENHGGHLEGWIRTWTRDISEFKEKSLFDDHTREEGIEWEGTEQTIDPNKLQKRADVFSEDDPRGSKNDLLDGHL